MPGSFGITVFVPFGPARKLLSAQKIKKTVFSHRDARKFGMTVKLGLKTNPETALKA